MQNALTKLGADHIRRLVEPADEQALVAMIFAAGGDVRIWPDPVSGRNRYGTKTVPAPEEISFSSTTASNVSSDGFQAAVRAVRSLFGRGGEAAVIPEQWFDEIGSDIVRYFGIPGAQCILAASGTDAELVALGLVAGLSKAPITNIFIAPDETGNGVPLAAAGRHFSTSTALGSPVEAGARIDGLDSSSIQVQSITIRDETGQPLDSRVIDDNVVLAVERELRNGRDVLLHILDCSKTGLTGLTRATAMNLARAAPGRVRVVVDACQLRSPVSQLKRDLADGFLVTITGSKFLAGPPFAGALLVPPSMVDEIASECDFAHGLSDYTAALDWPAALRDRLNFDFKSEINLGLGLRWIAAIATAEVYALRDEQQSATIMKHFADCVSQRARAIEGCKLHVDDEMGQLGCPSIVPITIVDSENRFAPMIEAQRVQLSLRNVSEGQICHIGQAVRVGPRNVLRIGMSARDVCAIANRIDAGQSIDRAFDPVANDLDTLFLKWSRIAHRDRAA